TYKDMIKMTPEAEKSTLRQKLEIYEGSLEHMYLDTKGYVTVGAGHLLPTLKDAQTLAFILQKNNKRATNEQIKTDYETIKKQIKGLLGSSYKKHTSLKLKKSDIDKLTNKHIDTFETELKRLYGSDEFSNYPSEVRLELFDMIFNLGMTNLKTKFPTFNKHIKENKWSDAAKESNRSDISATRNKYVKDLFEKAAKNAPETTPSPTPNKS